MSTTPLLTDVILRDGRTLRLREPCHDDRAALAAFLARLAPESLRLRFFATVRPDESLVDPYLDSDWNQRGALLGTLTTGADERVIALASYARLRDPRAAEVAFAVADAEHGAGIATRMLEQLAQPRVRRGDRALHLRDPADERVDAARRGGSGLRVRPRDRGRRRRGDDVDRADRRLCRDGGRARPHRGRDLHRALPRPREHRRLRRLGAAGDDRRRAVPERRQRRVRASRLSDQPHGRRGRRGSRSTDAPRSRARGRARPHLCSRGRGHRGRRRRAERRGPVDLRRVGGLRRGRIRRPGAAGSPACPRPGPWRAADRPELPRHRRNRGEHERDVRRAAAPARTRRVRLAERRARARGRRAGARARARTLVVRVARQQGRRLVQRSARVLGGRRCDLGRRAVPRELRQPAAIRENRPAGRQEEAGAGVEGRGHRGRCAGGCIAYRCARQLRRCGGCVVQAGRRAANADALGVPRRRDAALVAAAAAGRPRGDPDECRWAGDPLCRCVRGGGSRASAPIAEHACRSASAGPGRGEPREPDRRARIRHGRDVRLGAPTAARRSRVRCRLRVVRPPDRCDCRRRRRRGRCCDRGSRPREARRRGLPLGRDRRAVRAGQPGYEVRLARGRRGRSRARGTTSGMATPARRSRSRARGHRSRRCAGDRRGGARGE